MTTANSPETAPTRNAAPTGPTPDADFDTVVVLDFGSQYSQLIVRRLRELGVYSVLMPWDAPPEQIDALNPRGIVLSGGPASVYETGAPFLPDWVVSDDKPVLGICYGMQLLANKLGGEVTPAARREYGPATITISDPSQLFDALPTDLDVWMSHGDHVSQVPPGFSTLASSANAPIAAMSNGKYFGIQFHPEVAHTPRGRDVLRNFVVQVCQARTDWTPDHFIDSAVAQIQETVGDGRVLLALSGGVDSSVAAALLHRAIGDRLTPVFVDNGLLRQGEAQLVRDVFERSFGMKLVFVDASERFLAKLAGVTDPEHR
jgi:GMP synthase (glutamine-hydrolysing)